MRRFLFAGIILVAGLSGPITQRPAAAATLPAGFVEQVVFAGLNQPTDLEFSPDGRVFVAQKGGQIQVFDNLADATPTLFADLSVNVHNQWDRGLLGLAVGEAGVYVLYTYDAPPGQTAPVYNDNCASVPGGANGGNCVVTGRLSRLDANGNEQVLLHDWCQQFPSHSIGDIEFGADGMLYVTGGDGASFSGVDYGQLGSPANPCGDPSLEGGALRSQDLRAAADPTSLHGALLRLDPATGAAAPDNPLAGSSDPNARRIVAYGLRNPFRMAMRPGTSEPWISETGWTTWEEVNRVTTISEVTNFGWPCYEGTPRQPGYDSANLPICENLYATSGAVTAPEVAWNHASTLVPGEACPTGSSSSTGVALYPSSGGPYPVEYNGAVFFADYSRDCIWAKFPSANIITFASSAANPVDLEIGPGNELYYVDLGGTVRRVRYFAGNQPPVAVIEANPSSGPAPLAVAFNGAGSTDPDPADRGRLTYAWDFTSDGTVDSTLASPNFTYATAGTYTVRLTVTDTLGSTGTATALITAGSSAPSAVIDTPAAGTTWRVGDLITFSGHATDPEQGPLSLTWRVLLQHCQGTCHTHVLQTFSGVSNGSFLAPDHSYPSYLELEFSATDETGLTSTVTRRLDPLTVMLTFATRPGGLQLVVGGVAQAAPFSVTVIQGSTMTISAPTPQTKGRKSYSFVSWSDGGAQTHVLTAPNVATTFTANYRS